METVGWSVTRSLSKNWLRGYRVKVTVRCKMNEPGPDLSQGGCRLRDISARPGLPLRPPPQCTACPTCPEPGLGVPAGSPGEEGEPQGAAQAHTVGGWGAGLKEKCVDSLVFETLIPKPMLQHYIGLLLKHRRLVLSGPSGTGKTYLTNRLAEYLVERSGREVTEGIVSTFNMHQQSCKVAATPPAPSSLPFLAAASTSLPLGDPLSHLSPAPVSSLPGPPGAPTPAGTAVHTLSPHVPVALCPPRQSPPPFSFVSFLSRIRP